MIGLTPSLLTSSLTSLPLNMQMIKHFSAARQALLLSSGHFVPRWFPIGSSFGLLLLFLLLERSLGNNGADARGVRGSGEEGGGPAVPTSALPAS